MRYSTSSMIFFRLKSLYGQNLERKKPRQTKHRNEKIKTRQDRPNLDGRKPRKDKTETGTKPR